jgi:mono/diheme cytochrome c family protein
MKKILKWVGIVVGGLIGLLVLAIVAANVLANARLTRAFDIRPRTVVLSSSAVAVERGGHLVEAISHCVACHGADLGGAQFLDDEMLGSLYAANLTGGKGGIAAGYSDEDWVRAIAHGVSPDGRMLVGMPSDFYAGLSDQDLGAIIAYLKTVPPVDREPKPNRSTLAGNTLLGLGALGKMPVEEIDHAAARPAAVQPAETSEYGQYLVVAAGCDGCHMANYAGGRALPTSAYASNLTPGGSMAAWSEQEFLTAMKTGMLPSGRAVIPEMPWQIYGKMTDLELRAVWLYLRSLPALPNNP